MSQSRTDDSLLVIDGAQGEGGGQILRTSLALAIVTGRPVRLENIRAGRARPGLMRQHLAAVQAAAGISRARVTGDTLGSRQLTFEPDAVVPGDYRFDIGSAGSTLLVLQTVLPPLMLASRPSELLIEGGTHNPFAPPFPFIERSFLPMLRRMGFRVSATLERAGFYPAGGGRVRVRIDPPGELARLELTDPPSVRRCRASVLFAGLPFAVAERERAVLQAAGLFDDITITELPDVHGPGNATIAEAESSTGVVVFTSFGSPGVKAEKVATALVDELRRFLATRAAVDVHLADQLLLPLALARGGSFTTMAPSDHTTTNLDVIARFLDRRAGVQPLEENTWKISV